MSAPPVPHCRPQPEALVEQANDILAWVDADGRVLYINRAVAALLGHAPETLIGTPAWDLIHADDLASARAALEQAKARPDQPVVVDCRARHRQGGWRCLEVRGVWHADPAGAAAALVARDVTHARRRERLLAAWVAGMSRQPIQAGDFLRGICAALLRAHDLLLAYALRPQRGATPQVLAHACQSGDLLKDILAEDRADSAHFPGLGDADLAGAAPRVLTREALARLPWRAICERHDLAQVALVPLAGPEPVRLILCATHAQAFVAPEDPALLAELGRQVGVALDAIATHRRLGLLGGALAAAADAVFITDRDGVIEWVNAAFARLTGFTAEEAVGATPRIFRSGLHDAAYYDDLKRTIRRGRPWQGETINRRRDGSLYTAEQTITPIIEGRRQVRHFVAIQRDVTERKRLEAEVRDLALAIDRARAEERCLIARDIHDELGGSLAALKHDLEWLLGRDHDAGTRQRLELMFDLTEQTLAAARGLAASLHATPVDELGLAGALQWLARDFGERTGLAVRLDLPPAIDRLPAVAAAEVYRVVQECLTNVDKHARASQVHIRARVAEGRLELEVSDDGVGLVAAPPEPSAALGLRGMAERARLLGGYVEIDRVPEDGSRVRLVVPLETGAGGA